MRLRLQERLPETVTVRGKRWRLDMEFRNVLRMLDVMNREDLTPEARDYLAAGCLMPGRKKPPRDAGEVRELLDAVKDVLFEKEPARKGKKITSFEQDAGLIRAAFRQCYGIDLYRERLHWIEFSELLNGLPEGSRYSDVLGIRARPLPAPNKWNRQERENLMKAKAACALKLSGREAERDYSNTVADIFHVLAGLAARTDSGKSGEKSKEVSEDGRGRQD